MTVAESRFAEISKQARPYPSFLLPKEGTALALFAAGFFGWNDVVHFAREGLRCHCVDKDGEKLRAMAVIYPDDWSFTTGDAWDFAERARDDGQTWDVVSVDPFMGDAGERVLDDFQLWPALARQLVTIGVPASSPPRLDVPEGWDLSYYPRSSSVSWMVLLRD